MKDELKYIDEFYKANLTGLKEPADEKVWKALFWPLFWMRHKWLIMSAVVILLLTIGFYGWFFTGEHIFPVEDNLPKQHTVTVLATDKNNTENHEILKTDNFIVGKNIGKNEVNAGSNNNSTVELPSVRKSNIRVITNKQLVFANNDEPVQLREYYSINRLDSKDLTPIIKNKPDTLLLGDNRRLDILPEGMKNQRFSINLFIGSAYNRFSYSGYEPEYLDYLNQHESDSYSRTMGVDFKYHFKNWTLASGINYSVFNHHYDYSYTYNVYNPDNSYFDYDTTWVWIFDPPELHKPMIINIDSSWVKVYDEHKVSNAGFNMVSYFEIPVILGYRFNFHRFTIELNTGVSLGFMTSSHYKAPDFMNYNSIVEVEEVNKTMINYLASVTLYYQLDENFSLTISPAYKQGLKSVFSKTYPVNLHYKTFGVNLGVSYRF